MRPYRRPLDLYHGRQSPDPVEEAIWGYLGEGIADDLLQWLKTVVDPDTAAFIDTVIADEEEHEGHATDELRALLDADETGASRRRAGAAARRMLQHMAFSGTGGATPMVAFLRLGRGRDLLGGLVAGYRRRLADIGVRPADMLLPA